MNKVMSYELKGKRIECLYDDIFKAWIIQDGTRLISCCESFEQASERMDGAILELNNLDN